MVSRIVPASVSTLSIVASISGLLAAADPAPVSADPSDLLQAPPIPVQAQAEPQLERSAIDRRHRMDAVRNWGYWLSSFGIAGVAVASHDLLVIDSEISADRTFEREITPAEVARMKQRLDGSARVLLAYLSIGEAERYRPYWQQDWYDLAKKPAWLGNENRRWAGNFAVQYWQPEWQQLIFGGPESYLDRIIAHGFDGVYLDRADAFFEWQRLRPSARADMATFIARLAEHARKRNPQFLIVMQNAEELLEDAAVLEAIDGIAKEDLLYGVRRAEEANKPDDVSWSVDLLQAAQGAGRKVLVVEYLKDPVKIAAAFRRIADEGFVPYFAPRQLNCLNPPAVPTASGALPNHPCR
jgi:cysteinyl-tRNA synthetase